MIHALVAQRIERVVERHIRLRVDDDGQPLVVLGEGARLERVFENLIENALSFSPDGGLVAIAAARSDEDVVIRVEDEGPGVPEEAQRGVRPA
ncbi:hypothetical protein WR25_07766 [Diploscapter pachys]|uniref:histidine kinase n=1 Tax=Diploscapter pachys TaxID=2018661 RepID=A0A2A2M5B0_9BILA|nr:hypothetical protein WR25_07766 [Diploscapter pachys]